MLLATWNINGIKARHDTLCAWLKEAKPDLVCLQEIKSVDEAFPREEIESLGYNIATHGQKGFNGVALLSRLPLEDIEQGLPGDEEDQQARFLSARVTFGTLSLRVVCLYLPNGNPVETDKFPYKLSWMDRFILWTKEALKLEEPLVLAGDYNVIPQNRDAAFPEKWVHDALARPESRSRFRTLHNLGLTDALRATTDAGGHYTFWDYQAGAWPKNNGICIDHILLSPQAADRLQKVHIDSHVRGWDKPSDHVPVCVTLAE
jgi:exodeoxyribonuclease-3